MLAHMYQNIVLKNPKAILVLLIITVLSFGYYTKDFRLDASSETLLIDGDPDLAYLKEVSERYGSREFLILTYTPNEGMVADTSINNLLSLKYKIQSLNWVHSVVTLLDIPLLSNSDAPLQERLESFKTLKDEISWVFLYVVVLVSIFFNEKSDFENEILVTSEFIDVMVAPSYRTKIGVLPICLNFPFLAYVI